MFRNGLVCVAVFFAFGSCGGPKGGTERGACYGNGTCNDGLTCASDVCVKLESKQTRATAKPAETPLEVCKKIYAHVGKVLETDMPEMTDATAKSCIANELWKHEACIMAATSQKVLFACLEHASEQSPKHRVAKSKTTEAREFTKKLYDGARAYYMDGAPSRGGMTPVAKQFPLPSVGPTPPVGSCCNGGSDKCTPDASLWTDATWVALQFSVDDPHYYSYRYVSDGSTFTVSAFGDLDCDGVFSTFEMYGSVSPDGNVSGDASLFRQNELE